MVDDGRTTDDGRTDGRTTEHGYTISSPCEPDGSGELNIPMQEKRDIFCTVKIENFLVIIIFFIFFLVLLKA